MKPQAGDGNAIRTGSRSCLFNLTVLLSFLVFRPPLPAAVIVVDGACTLVDAITAANIDNATGGCPSGSGADEIQLTIDVILTEVDNDSTFGPNGLPSITSVVTIRSSDASLRTIGRSAGSPEFRILHNGIGGNLSLENLVVSNGDAGSWSGGGIYSVSAQLALTNTIVSGNAGGIGGGIHSVESMVTLTNSTVSSNSASAGGGILNEADGTVILTNSTVSGNTATVGAGGGIFNWERASAALSNSTVSSNSSAFFGGGIFNDASLTLTNSTVSGNSANEGGGIGNFENGTLTLTHSTVSGNSAALGGGGIANQAPGTATLAGSLVGNSPSGGNCFGEITDGGNNLADSGGCGGIPNNLIGLDPTLADNGGPTLTHALLPGSNAIDLVGDCGLPTDQRLAPRDDGDCDAGSFEFGAIVSEPIFTDGFESGDTSAWSSTVP